MLPHLLLHCYIVTLLSLKDVLYKKKAYHRLHCKAEGAFLPVYRSAKTFEIGVKTHKCEGVWTSIKNILFKVYETIVKLILHFHKVLHVSLQEM